MTPLSENPKNLPSSAEVVSGTSFFTKRPSSFCSKMFSSAELMRTSPEIFLSSRDIEIVAVSLTPSTICSGTATYRPSLFCVSWFPSPELMRTYALRIAPVTSKSTESVSSIPAMGCSEIGTYRPSEYVSALSSAELILTFALSGASSVPFPERSIPSSWFSILIAIFPSNESKLTSARRLESFVPSPVKMTEGESMV